MNFNMYYVIYVESEEKYVTNSRLRSLGMWYSDDLLLAAPFSTIGEANQEIRNNWEAEGGVVHVVKSEKV